MRTVRFMIILTVAALIMLLTPSVAQAGTPAYWRSASCGDRGTVGVGWQQSGSLRRPTRIRFVTNFPAYRTYADYYVNGSLRATVSYPGGGYGTQWNWDGLGWHRPAPGMWVRIRVTGRAYQFCQGSVGP